MFDPLGGRVVRTGDAVLRADGLVLTLVGLSPTPEQRRGHEAVNNGRVDPAR
ncbi:hypothetical protein [Saccharothrix xinjiangensis]|uniref:Uncharacterized protein n=1 Tax=Saccharothrix xinjiangensis TaxID=204798 RepID=A0ABV9XUX2_9PSEU